MAFVKPHLPAHLTCTYPQHCLTCKGHFQADKRPSLRPKQHTNYRYAERGPTCHFGLYCCTISEPKLTSIHPNRIGVMLCLLRQQVQLRMPSSAELKVCKWLLQKPLFFSSWFDQRAPSQCGWRRQEGEGGSNGSGERNPQRSKINDSRFTGRQETQLTPKLRHSSMADKHPDGCWLCRSNRKPSHAGTRTQRAGSPGPCWALLLGRQLATGASARHGILHLAKQIPFESKGWTGSKALQKRFLWVNTAKWTAPNLDTPPYGFCLLTNSVKQRALLQLQQPKCCYGLFVLGLMLEWFLIRYLHLALYPKSEDRITVFPFRFFLTEYD